jgi:hypothetical protein
MAEDKVKARSATAISRTAALLAFAGAATFVVLLVTLHFIKPGLDPSWRMVSEYEIGRHGWIMVLAFLSLAFSCVALLVAVRSQIRTTGGRVGLALLLVSAAGITIAATLISWGLARDQAWSAARGSLLWMAALTLIGLLVFVASVAVMLPRANGEFGPEVPIGWPNRLLVLAYSAWLMVAPWQAIRVGKQRRFTEENLR